ncbi:E3 ubiquitin-protein ligase RNF181 homolog [Oryza brachyantha]|uniref:E3 ubiquitin-protein ligase RNF181 homolog n=1 Tax=Oryza brachyantha TaxID=4533 RepID=UPI001ADA1854|nr:E3 ubiquitin-protein ligase RNF181 homolog [Oryza brachyantha]
MASANGGERAAAGILRLLLGMGMMGPSVAMPGGGGGAEVMMVQHIIIGDGGGDLFSAGLGGGVPPASKAAIASLKEVRAGEAEEGSLGDCAICLDAFDAGKEMPCGHRFHGECLDRWLGVHGSCPVCRRELPAAEPAAEQQNGGAGADAGERRRPRAVLVSYLVLGDGGGGGEERQEPWNIRIEDVD